ncbi:hypothetical protein D9758_016547 [Tetrapyrgos nigripes]|uniref:AB hydrolase-1 domain-containing protein n=1 Tax=Tetrapyrgos nigripes TaxID=182062 RepID=A0A8H5CBR8_9AGAR|nr:hypothetical protein D9758_016547 [Tetrapyrgos nigripes]
MLFQVLSSLLLALTAGASSLSQVDAPAPFNSSLFKDLNVSRGLNYHYYAVPADTGKPTLLFLHGFPSTSYDWRHQVAFFQEKGYGLLVPDLLGYGGTSKPLDPQLYVSSLVTRDIVDILDSESIDQAVVVAHDWGSKTASRLAHYFPERFLSYGFLAVGYVPPTFFATPYEERLNLSEAVLGYKNLGYWDFFSSEGADQTILNHLDSLWDILYPNDTTRTITDWSPLGALEAFITNDTRIAPVDYVTPEERAIQIEAIRQGGLAAPLNWYKIVRGTLEGEDDQGISPENALIHRPVFFGAALRDYISVAPIFVAGALVSSNSTVTIREYNSGHWVQMAFPDEINSDLLQWIEGLGSDA